MAEKREYRLKIDAYSPETMPMKCLVEYLSDLSVLFGEESHVHLIAIESSSTCPVMLIDREAEPKVLDRVSKAHDQRGPQEAIRAIESINSRLVRDNASANILNPAKNNVMEFPGAKSAKPIEWPSINQAGELYGTPIAIGGKSDPVPVHLLDGTTEYHLLAERVKAKQIAAHLFTATLRVMGRGRWRKCPTGTWDLERFVIEDFELIKVTTLDEAVTELRGVKAKWKQFDDPLAILEDIRTGEQNKPNGGVR
jgi:hypothetical protein